ncbi:ankyrin repeat-containing domain protein [Pelagophyceae sp. CCMP2097]|nr:ankyrin repeat-containing domain protein [Pelagophyceae sp. CCMP2097]
MRHSIAVIMAASSCAARAPCARMFLAAENGHVALVEDLLAQGCDTHSRDANGLTAACAAAANGHVDVLGALLRAGAAVNQATGDRGYTLLIRATEADRRDAADVLIAHGAAVDQASIDGSTPLMFAVAQGHSVVDVLVAHGAAVDQVMSNGITPLKLAASRGFAGVVDVLNFRSDVVKIFQKNGADLNRATHDGRTPAFAAAFVGHAVAFDLFLGALGCDANQANHDGWTAAHVATMGAALMPDVSAHAAVLTSLLRAGCDVTTVKTKLGETPSQFARRYKQMRQSNGNMAAIELLDTASPMRGRAVALFSLVFAFLGSWALYQARGAGPRADAAYLDLVRDADADQAVRRNGAPSKPRSTTTKRRREKTKPGSVRRTMHEDADAAAITTTKTSGEPRGASTLSRTLSSEPPAADDNDEAAIHIDESSEAGDAASFSVEEVKEETCDDEHTRLVEAPPPPDDFDDATTVALLESLGLGSLLAVFREHEIDDSALRYLEPGDLRDMDIPLAYVGRRAMPSIETDSGHS